MTGELGNTGSCRDVSAGKSGNEVAALHSQGMTVEAHQATDRTRRALSEASAGVGRVLCILKARQAA